MTAAYGGGEPSSTEVGSNDGFSYVTRAPRRGKLRKGGRRGQGGDLNEDDAQSPAERLEQRTAIIQSRKSELLRQPELQPFLKRFAVETSAGTASDEGNTAQHGDHANGFDDAMALGLGSVKDARSAQIQLALFLILCDHVKSRGKAQAELKMCAYDPICDGEDDALLMALDIEPLKENQRGGYELTKRTLVYMPHCPRALYENMLRSNWSAARLLDLVLCCNELERYATGIAAADKSSPCIQKIVPLLKVLPVPAMTDVAGNALNDLAVQTFVAPADDPHDTASDVNTLQAAVQRLSVRATQRTRSENLDTTVKALPPDFWTLAPQLETASGASQSEIL